MNKVNRESEGNERGNGRGCHFSFCVLLKKKKDKGSENNLKACALPLKVLKILSVSRGNKVSAENDDCKNCSCPCREQNVWKSFPDAAKVVAENECGKVCFRPLR